MRLVLAMMVALGAASAVAAPRYVAPKETARLAPGEGVEMAEAVCSACHSVDYITTQPRSLADPKAFWAGTVAKMQTAYGAKFEPETSAAITDYLARTYP